MENISAGLKWAIGIVATLLIVAAGISIYMVSQGFLTRAQEQTLSQSESVNEFAVYDNGRFTGSEVLEITKRYQTRPSFTTWYATKLQTSYVNPPHSGTGASSCYQMSTPTTSPGACSNTTFADMQKTTHNHYINPTANFTSQIYKDANGIVRAIAFTQQ
jgi:hypothetical protein